MDKQDETPEMEKPVEQAAPGDTVAEAVPQYKRTEKIIVPEKGKLYTFSDYLTWNDGKRWELIDGVPIEMTSPSWEHQIASMELGRQLSNFLKGKPCKVVACPYDIRLNADGLDDTVVQPDILVICDHSKRSKHGYKGAPDLAIEILSPSTARHDRLVKLELYERYGVREYWIVDIESSEVTVYIMENGKYVVKTYSGAGVVPVRVLEGCKLDFAEVFSE